MSNERMQFLGGRFKEIFVLLLLLVIVLVSGCISPHYISNDNDNEIKHQLDNIHAFRVGNPLGEDYRLVNTRYLGQSARWWGAGTCAVILGVSSIFFPPAAFGIPVAAGLGYGAGCALDAYYGGPFDYAAYKIPEKPELVVFWFSGADEGACSYTYYGPNCDYYRAAREYGDECIAMFNFNDVEKALEYSEKLPKGTKVIVRGHSMGGSAAFRFVSRLPRHISVLLLDTRDPTSWFGQKRVKPDNVQFWRNVLPGDANIFTSKEKHKNTNYFGNVNASNLFMILGRPWGICSGAQNIVLPNGDHNEVGRY